MEFDQLQHLMFKFLTMKSELHLEIPTPCTEKWNSFTPTSRGGYCASCQKEVIDFTTWTDEQLIQYFKRHPQNTCGRFRPRQLKAYTVDDPRSSDWRWLSAATISALLILGSREGLAQEKRNSPTEQVPPNSLHPSPTRPATVTLSGTVLDDAGLPLPGVNVIQPGTNMTTVTDAEGRFKLVAMTTGDTVGIEFSFIGFITLNRRIPITESGAPFVVTMALDEVALNEVVYVGGCHVRWYSPRTWWGKLRNLFTR